jgi:hypothetical protein
MPAASMTGSPGDRAFKAEPQGLTRSRGVPVRCQPRDRRQTRRRLGEPNVNTDPRRGTTLEYGAHLGAMAAAHELELFATVVPRHQPVTGHARHGRPTVMLRPGCSVAVAYRGLPGEVIERLGWRGLDEGSVAGPGSGRERVESAPGQPPASVADESSQAGWPSSARRFGTSPPTTALHRVAMSNPLQRGRPRPILDTRHATTNNGPAATRIRAYQPDRASRTKHRRTATHPADHNPPNPTRTRQIRLLTLTNSAPYQLSAGALASTGGDFAGVEGERGVLMVARSRRRVVGEAAPALRCAGYSNFARLLCCGPSVASSARPSAQTQAGRADGYAT